MIYNIIKVTLLGTHRHVSFGIHASSSGEDPTGCHHFQTPGGGSGPGFRDVAGSVVELRLAIPTRQHRFLCRQDSSQAVAQGLELSVMAPSRSASICGCANLNMQVSQYP
jgi:hypothetical protein